MTGAVAEAFDAVGGPPRADAVPCLVGRRRYPVRGARLPRLLERKMVSLAEGCGATLRGVPDDEWYATFRRAAWGVRGALRVPPAVDTIAARTGLPLGRVRRALEGLAADLEAIDEVLACQSPDGALAAYRTGHVNGRPWRWLPAGRHVAVRVPDNFPTINIEWLQAVAARRPAILNPAPGDPFTPTLLADALYEAGLPDGAISVAQGEAPGLWGRADQVLWPGDVPGGLRGLGPRLKTYHQARSKVVVATARPDPGWWPELARLSVQGCGRLCTNPSAVLAGDRDGVARALAEALARYEVMALDDPRAVVPAHRGDAAHRINAVVAAAVRRGAVDVSEQVTGLPRIVTGWGEVFLRPTVLAMDVDDPLFGVNLPFPFVAVGTACREDIVGSVRGSLVVWLLGADVRLVEATTSEPTVGKVLSEDALDRAYDPRDPHEGYVADFLFQKKAVFA